MRKFRDMYPHTRERRIAPRSGLAISITNRDDYSSVERGTDPECREPWNRDNELTYLSLGKRCSLIRGTPMAYTETNSAEVF